MRQNLAIVGFSESTRDLAPFDDESFDIWGCNHIHQFVPRVDATFELHSPAELESKYGSRYEPYREFLKGIEAPRRLIMQGHYDEFPASEALPIDELKSEFGWNEKRESGIAWASTFKSSLSYMLAMAIREGYKRVHVYGVDMVIDEEWGYQRNNFSFFLGWARGAGVDIVIPEDSRLMKEGALQFYGYDHKDTDRYAPVIRSLKQRVEQYDEHLAQRRAEHERKQDEFERMRGRLDEVTELAAVDEPCKALAARMAELPKQIEAVDIHLRRMLDELHYLDGKRDGEHDLLLRLLTSERGELADRMAVSK